MEASRKLKGSNPVSALATGAASKMLAVQPDRVLCTLALRGNDTAFEVLYSRYHRSIYAFIYHLLGRGANAEDAADLAQDTFGSAFDKLDARREGGSFKAWLYTIARNRTFDHIKSDKTNPADELDPALEADGGASAELSAEQRAQMLWLVSALHELPERQRQALVMRELGGMSYDEIAESIGTTVPGVKQLINRARGTVTNAAAIAGYNPKQLRSDMLAVAPLVPLAASSGAFAALGIGGGSAVGVSAGIGGFGVAVKLATVVVAVAAVGGGVAGVDHAVPRSSDATARAADVARTQLLPAQTTTGLNTRTNRPSGAPARRPHRSRAGARHPAGSGGSHAPGARKNAALVNRPGRDGGSGAGNGSRDGGGQGHGDRHNGSQPAGDQSSSSGSGAHDSADGAAGGVPLESDGSSSDSMDGGGDSGGSPSTSGSGSDSGAQLPPGS